MNCWEFKKCKNKEDCPAFPDRGQECAWVKNTLCNNGTQRLLEEKLLVCASCDFLRKFHKQPYKE